MDLSNTADSMGIVHNADVMFGIINTDELSELGQVMIRFMKNRYGDCNKFVLGLSKPKMKFYDLEASAQNGLVGNVQQPVVAAAGKPQKIDPNSVFGIKF